MKNLKRSFAVLALTGASLAVLSIDSAQANYQPIPSGKCSWGSFSNAVSGSTTTYAQTDTYGCNNVTARVDNQAPVWGTNYALAYGPKSSYPWTTHDVFGPGGWGYAYLNL